MLNKAIYAVLLIFIIAVSSFLLYMFVCRKSHQDPVIPIGSASLHYENGISNKLAPFVQSSEWKRICYQPFPIYTKNNGVHVNIDFKKERIYANGRLFGLVYKNFHDLLDNAKDLSKVEFLMCFGRLSDSRASEYLAKMSAVRSVVCFSPLPKDMEILGELLPNIEVLDMDLEYWKCPFDLSVFKRLCSLAIRGKYSLELVKQNRNLLSLCQHIYLPETRFSEIDDCITSLSTCSIRVATKGDLREVLRHFTTIPSLRTLELYLEIIPQALRIADIPPSLHELSLVGLSPYMRDKIVSNNPDFFRDAANMGIMIHVRMPSGTGEAVGRTQSFFDAKCVETSEECAGEDYLSISDDNYYLLKCQLPYSHIILSGERESTYMSDNEIIVHPLVRRVYIKQWPITVRYAKNVLRIFPNIEYIIVSSTDPDEDAITAFLDYTSSKCIVQIQITKYSYSFTQRQISKIALSVCNRGAAAILPTDILDKVICYEYTNSKATHNEADGWVNLKSVIVNLHAGATAFKKNMKYYVDYEIKARLFIDYIFGPNIDELIPLMGRSTCNIVSKNIRIPWFLTNYPLNSYVTYVSLSSNPAVSIDQVGDYELGMSLTQRECEVSDCIIEIKKIRGDRNVHYELSLIDRSGYFGSFNLEPVGLSTLIYRTRVLDDVVTCYKWKCETGLLECAYTDYFESNLLDQQAVQF